MELLRITRKIHYKAVEQTATLIHRQYNRDWGTSYSRPPIDPYLTSPCYKILAAPQHGGYSLVVRYCLESNRHRYRKMKIITIMYSVQCLIVFCPRIADKGRWTYRNYDDNDFTFQQDGALSYISNTR